MAADPQTIATSFVQAYYNVFDTNRAAIGTLYVADGVLSYEGANIQGRESITQKLLSLPFKTIIHSVSTLDSHVTVDGGLLVLVIGQLKSDADPPLGFCDTFYVKQYGESLFIQNQMFRLNLHHN